MRNALFAATAAAVLMIGGSQAAHANITLFGFESGEPELPFVDNNGGAPGAYAPTIISGTTADGVTQGTNALQVVSTRNAFGGALSVAFTDPAVATLIDTSSDLFLDVKLPAYQLSYGNIDLSFNQDGTTDETAFSLGNLGAFAPGTEHTLDIPLTNTQFGNAHVELNPADPFSFQFDFSYGANTAGTPPSPAPSAATPYTFVLDNLSVASTPEPASIAGIVLGGGALLARRRKA